MADLLRRDGTPLPRRVDRRAIIKASAGLAAASVLGRPRPATAQGAGTTIAGEWVESHALGFFAMPQGIGGEYAPEPITFQADFPFQGIAPHWDSSEDPGAGIEISVSPDGVNWSNPVWSVESADGGPPDRNGRRFGRMVSTPGASFVRYRTFDVAGNPATLPGLTFSYLDASAGPTLIEVAQPALDPSLNQPPIISRASWGADESLRFNQRGREIWPVEYQTAEHVVIHHTDTTNFEDPVLGLRLIYYYHTVTRGWGDIGYNYIVDFLGNIYEGRVGGENAVAGHAFQYNWGSTGIAIMGRYFDEPMTPEMRNGLTWITAWACRSLDPMAVRSFQDIPSLPTICAHRDVNPTSCPGDALYGEIQVVREAARDVLAGTLDPAPPPPDFLPGEMVMTSGEEGVLRDMPTLEANVLTRLAAGEIMTVQDGPTTNDGSVWYQVQGSSMTGWITVDLLVSAAGEAPPPVDTGGDDTDARGNRRRRRRPTDGDEEAEPPADGSEEAAPAG